MFEHVGDDDRIGVAREAPHLLEVGDHDAIEPLAQRGKVRHLVFESHRAREMIAHGLAELAAGRAEVEQPAAFARIAANQLDENPVAAAFEILEGVNIRHAGGGWYRNVGLGGLQTPPWPALRSAVNEIDDEVWPASERRRPSPSLSGCRWCRRSSA